MTAFDAAKGKNIDYPRKEEGGKIFEWYTQNHKAYSKDKKTKLKYMVGSPLHRKQEYYREYMIPMQIGLGKIDPGYDVEVVGCEGNNVILKNEENKRISLSFDSLTNLNRVQKNVKRAQNLKKGTKFKIIYRKKQRDGRILWEATKL